MNANGRLMGGFVVLCVGPVNANRPTRVDICWSWHHALCHAYWLSVWAMCLNNIRHNYTVQSRSRVLLTLRVFRWCSYVRNYLIETIQFSTICATCNLDNIHAWRVVFPLKRAKIGVYKSCRLMMMIKLRTNPALLYQHQFISKLMFAIYRYVDQIFDLIMMASQRNIIMMMTKRRRRLFKKYALRQKKHFRKKPHDITIYYLKLLQIVNYIHKRSALRSSNIYLYNIFRDKNKSVQLPLWVKCHIIDVSFSFGMFGTLLL